LHSPLAERTADDFDRDQHAENVLLGLYGAKMAAYGSAAGSLVFFFCFFNLKMSPKICNSVCNLNGYDSRNITITFFPNLFQRLSIPKKA
jgi:hypothetical protein